MIGDLPQFVEFTNNLNTYFTDKDNIILQLYHNNETVTQVGDTVWASVFPGYYLNRTDIKGYITLSEYD